MEPSGGQTKLQTMLRQARDLATTGNYESCAEVADVLRSDPSFALIEPWLADHMFRTQLTALCEEARKNRHAHRT